MTEDPLRDRYAYLNVSDRNIKIYDENLARERQRDTNAQPSLFDITGRESESKPGSEVSVSPSLLNRDTTNEQSVSSSQSESFQEKERSNEEFNQEIVRDGEPIVEAVREMSWTAKMEASESKTLNNRDELMFASAGQNSQSWSAYIDPSKDPMATARSLGLGPQMDRMEQNHREAMRIDRGEGLER